MLQYLGAGDIAILIDMANYKNGHALTFGQMHQGHGAILHLGHTAGRRLVFFIVEGLNRVGDENIRFHFLNRFQNVRKSGFGKDIQCLRGHIQPLGTEFQLTFAFLTRHIENPAAGTKAVANLKKKR